MKAGGPQDSTAAQRVSGPGVSSLTKISGALPATLASGTLNERFAGRAVAGQFMGFDEQGFAKLKTGNLVLQLLLPVGTKMPAIGARLVVNIAAQDRTLGVPTRNENILDSDHEDVDGPVLRSFISQLDQAELEQGAENALRRKLADSNQDPNKILDKAEVSEEGQLLGRVVDRIHPRETVRLQLLSTQLGLLGDADTETSREVSSGSGRHPLMEALGLKAADGLVLGSKINLLARQIAQAVERSGLFYESHLRQWKDGKRTKQSLLEEPQNDWKATAALGGRSGDAMQPEQVRASLMANQQLNLLINPRLMLMFPGLQGETIQVTLQREDPEGDDRQEGHPDNSGKPKSGKVAAWSFELVMHLQKVGQVKAKLMLSGLDQSLQLEVEPEYLAQFRLFGHEIKETLQLSGLVIRPKSPTKSDENP